MRTDRDKAHRMAASLKLLQEHAGQLRTNEFYNLNPTSSKNSEDFDEIWVILGQVYSKLFDAHRHAENVYLRETME